MDKLQGDTSEAFKRNADVYDKHRTPFPDSAREALFTHFGLKRGSTIADIGAGTGHVSVPLAKDNIVYHIDKSADMNDVARAKYRPSPGDTGVLHFIEAKASETGIPDKSVDAIMMTNTAHWLTGDDYADNLAEMHRILKPDGKVIIAHNFINAENTQMMTLNTQLKHLFPSGRLRLKDSFAHGVDNFVRKDGRQEYAEVVTKHMTKEDFVGWVSTFSYVIKDGMDEEHRKAVEQVFDEYAKDTADGKRIAIEFRTAMYCNDLVGLEQARGRRLG